jgi:Glutamine amidotransferases class-II
MGRSGSVCRLFGLTAGGNRVRATFWLLDAPDSLEAQSHRNADGAGLGYFGPDGGVVLDKQPEAAFRDREFQRAARQADSSAFVAHVRWATTGGRSVRNTHPFGMKGRVMAHNGGFGPLARLEAELGPYAGLVLGDTDSLISLTRTSWSMWLEAVPARSRPGASRPGCGTTRLARGSRGRSPCSWPRPPGNNKCQAIGLAFHVRSPDRIRTGVTALRGRRPRPLDDGAVL